MKNFIEVTQKNNKKILVNVDLIAFIDYGTHNSKEVGCINFTEEHYFNVLETYDEIKSLIGAIS